MNISLQAENGETLGETEYTLEVLDAELPESDFPVTHNRRGRKFSRGRFVRGVSGRERRMGFVTARSILRRFARQASSLRVGKETR